MSPTEYTTIPAGLPPAKLESGEDEAILEWCKSCQAARPKERLANEALKYWLRYFYRVMSPEHERICERIDVLVKDIAPVRAPYSPGQGGVEDLSEG